MTINIADGKWHIAKGRPTGPYTRFFTKGAWKVFNFRFFYIYRYVPR